MKINYLLFLVLLTVSSCGGRNQSNSKLSGEIRIDGSSTVYTLTEAIAEEFRTEYPDVDISIGISGTGGGFKKFARGENDIANASRPIKDIEAEAARENNISYIELKVAYDGLAVVANHENDWLDSISVEDLKKIWEPAAQGKIMKWNQVRPEWPDKEIRLFGPGVASGTYDYFTEAIVGETGSSRGDFTASEDDNVLVQGVAGDKYSLGFFGLAYYSENKDKLRLIAVDGGDGPVLPAIETVMNGTYKPLSRPLFIYVNSLAAERDEVRELVSFYLENAGALASEVGYVPMAEDEYENQKTLAEKFFKVASEGQKQQ